jgi:hypothetical protein
MGEWLVEAIADSSVNLQWLQVETSRGSIAVISANRLKSSTLKVSR